jgi:hypothetical protein
MFFNMFLYTSNYYINNDKLVSQNVYSLLINKTITYSEFQGSKMTNIFRELVALFIMLFTIISPKPAFSACLTIYFTCLNCVLFERNTNNTDTVKL